MSIEAELVSRYGPNILKANRRQIPPRRARKGHHLAVQPKAGRRNKLVKELKQEGYKAHVARHRETKEVTTRFVFANALPAFAKHAASVLAEIPTPAIRPLYGHRQPVIRTKPYEAGDLVRVTAGPCAGMTATLEKRNAKATWTADINGRRVVIHINNMIRIDPG